ncbi:alpha-ketoglutarate-dependent taurine dioxygenase [Streptomyces sp. 2132.2]|uniref:TauD/TfdA family dioxygenase n=1 Tax=Streptomyces TaxID=1883 RepID=UPI000F48E877|nr:TauD/TfdA family dioxygenase [Streptomyces sp. 2132.2]ROQ96962.1 alpha-ketoglutarate-dependent taurine dioxygenase [Streptomyces sp. 2132.2]
MMSKKTVGSLSFEPGFPSVVQLVDEEATPAAILAKIDSEQRETVERLMEETGAILFRGFNVLSIDEFEDVARSLLGDLAAYKGGDAPRHAERGLVYNASGPDRTRAVRAHNELSYAPWHPERLVFGCSVVAAEGGATTIVDGHRVYASLPAEVREAFRDRGVTYIQHLPNAAGDPSGIKSWPETFETDARDDVIAHCRSSYTTAEWTPLGLLTTNRTPGTVEVGADRRQSWFNQTHIWRKDPSTVPDVTDMERWKTWIGYGATFGDGTEIPTAYMELVRTTLEECEVAVEWKAGDVLLVDNRAAMHGRRPYSGDRQVFVAFA